ncbi:alpha-(1,3)-fucosyltransferase C-like [Hyalella azteca]|uniref:Fucosyltransferase n=1 Tax=Hyalella azteca TaxID=294128 RepID=A0A8B7NHV2_HYAAZ|nr:alpha-(1,3)-fucosyltransferase C-like [Hyalella azteca]
MTGKWLEWCILCCATFLVVIYTWPLSPTKNYDQAFQQLVEISARNSSSANPDPKHPDIRDTNTASQKPVQKPVTWLQLVRAEMLARPADLIREHPTFYFGVGQDPFLRAGCPVSSCYITTNRTEVPYQKIDALVWIPIENDKSFPPVRSPHTRYIYYDWEPPLVAGLGKKQLDSLKYVFNYTMTYRRDSDIFNPYGVFRPLATPRLLLSTKDYSRGKNKQAVWFVSNCEARSGRDMLGEELNYYISVDVYGRCGSMSCSRSIQNECYRRAAETYKFYLSFENSLCDDYITEKFFLTARYDILPVVFGLGAYEVVAPPHSFINAFDFPSIRHLADYLIYLDKNNTAYNEYFRPNT